MRFWNRIVVSAALAAGLAVAGGTAGASRVPAAAPKGSCELVTVREVGTILGTPAGSGKSTVKTVAGVKNESCEWKAKKKGTGGLDGKPLSLEIAVQSGQGVADTFQSDKAEDPTDIEEVPGLGDGAFLEDLGLDLHVLVGQRVVTVEMHNYRYPNPLTQEQIQQKEEDAAKLALGRLSPA